MCSGSLLIALPQVIPAWFSISRWIQWIRVWVAVSILRFSQGSKSANVCWPKNTPLRGPSPCGGGGRGRDPNLAGHGREEHHNTAEEEQSYQTPIYPSKGENGKGKRSESKGYRKEYQSSSSKRRAWTRWNRGGWDWHRSWWKRCHDMEKNIWGLGVSYVSHLACRVAIISGSVNLLLDFHNAWTWDPSILLAVFHFFTWLACWAWDNPAHIAQKSRTLHVERGWCIRPISWFMWWKNFNPKCQAGRRHMCDQL